MGINDVSKYGPILRKYNLHPSAIEDHGKVKKVMTKQGTFALKTISNKINLHFPGFLQNLFQQGYTRAVPIYPAADGSYLVYYDQSYHYLMPWLQNKTAEERGEQHRALFKEVARMHVSSSRKHVIEDESDITKHYETVVTNWEERNQYVEAFVEEAEKKLYMSPFELQFCTYFHEVNLAIRFSRSQLDKWYELMQEKKSFRTALTHGNPSVKHFLYDEKGKGYLTNFEKAVYANPINDLVSMYFRILKTYPVLCDDCLDWFKTYQDHFPLRDEEIYLLLGYLSYPEPVYRCIKNYQNNHKNKSEREHVQVLQKTYWLTKNIEYLVVKILEAQEQKNMELEEEEEESHTEQ